MAENNISFVWFVRVVCCFALISNFCFARKHDLHIKDDDRKEFVLSTFGFLKGGELTVDMSGFTSSDGQRFNDAYGFTLDRSSSAGASKYLEGHDAKCVLREDDPKSLASISLVRFTLNLKEKCVEVLRLGSDVQDLEISYGIPASEAVGEVNQPDETGNNQAQVEAKTTTAGPESKSSTVKTQGGQNGKGKNKGHKHQKQGQGGQGGTGDGKISTVKTTAAPNTRKRRAAADEVSATVLLGVAVSATPSNTEDSDNAKTAATVPPMKTDIVHKSLPTGNISGVIPMVGDEINGYNVSFRVRILEKKQAGLFNVFFHNCRNYDNRNETRVSFALNIVEKNANSYLSAGAVPLPVVYFTLSACFFLAGLIWFFVLRHAPKLDVFKLHYIMLTVVWMKCVSLLFHAVDYHFIGKNGVQEEGWAIVFYIAHLVKGALLFSTIVLIGAGWSFIKHMLSDNVKKVFLIVIPLQIIANTASIIIEETEESAANYSTWSQVFILVDLLCCGAILFPVVWSIRHLQEGAEVDGKAAMNLQKLQLFKQFYIIVVCYIYFTRIIVYLLNATLPFQYTWIDEVIREGGTLFFFVLTGSKFRPADNNPYLQVPQEDDDDYEMEEVITTTGATETLRRVNTARDSDDSDTEINTTEIKHREKTLVD